MPLSIKGKIRKNPVNTRFLESSSKQITGIEPASPAWEAGVLPMNYICEDTLVSCVNDTIIAYRPEKSRAKARKSERSRSCGI